MWTQVSEHCINYKLQPDYQSAYRPHYSCETSLLKLSNDILWAFEKQHIMALMALDLSAAFNTVNHDVLLQILSHKFGITGNALHWFEEYLQPHSFKVFLITLFLKRLTLSTVCHKAV